MDEIKSNSMKSREVKKEKIVQNAVSVKPKSFGRRVSDSLIQRDGKDVKDYLFFDLFIPFVKDLISTACKTAVDMTLYGEVRGGTDRRTFSGSPGHTPYDRVIVSNPNRRRDTVLVSPRNRICCDELLFDSYDDAMDIIDDLCESIERYSKARVQDVYDLAGKSCDYTYQYWGWTDLSTATVGRDGNKFYLKLPAAIPLDRI